MRCMPLLTVTTRDPGVASRAASSSPVSAKWPRWLVPSCISKPSAVSRRGQRHHAGVVEQDVERGSCLARTPRRSAPDVGEAREVERHQLVLRTRVRGADLPLGGASPSPGRGRRGPRARLAGQASARLVAEPAVGAGDDDGLAGQVGEIGCGPGGHGGRVAGSRGQVTAVSGTPPCPRARCRSGARSRARPCGAPRRAARPVGRLELVGALEDHDVVQVILGRTVRSGRATPT